MNTRNPSMKALKLSLLTVALACSGSIIAQTELDTRRLDSPQTRTQSCGQVDIAWNLELISQYPRIAEACHEVVTNNNIKWARFEADFVRINSDGSVTSDFLSPTGRSMGRYTFVPAEGQQVTLDGRKEPFSALRQNQRINLYVPEGATHLASQPVADPSQYSRFTRYEETQAAEPMQYARMEEAAPTQYASVSQDRTRLPDTAGALPWFALGGLLSALAGAGLRIGRKR
jgi:hypothetical protein